MKAEDRREMLLTHYKRWMETTINENHKEYATNMYEAVLNGNHAEVFKNIGNSTDIFIAESGRIFYSVKEASKFFNLSLNSIAKGYKYYGLRKISIR